LSNKDGVHVYVIDENITRQDLFVIMYMYQFKVSFHSIYFYISLFQKMSDCMKFDVTQYATISF